MDPDNGFTLLSSPHKMILLFLFSRLLIPMDATQTDHLKAYGLTYWVLEQGLDAEWLLNYRGGSFLLPSLDGIKRRANVMGVRWEEISEDQVNDIYAEIERGNLERVLLEKAPRIAVYIPEFEGPWDDAVTLALEYAEIPYDRIWDPEVLNGDLRKYDWLHLHHEDFTGQFGKFYLSYRNAPWYKKVEEVNRKTARRLGYRKVWQMKHDVARRIREYVENGGFLFAMCSAPITLDIALAYLDVDIVPEQIDGDGIDPAYRSKVDFSRTFAFTNFNIIPQIAVYEHSDVDVTREAAIRGKKTRFVLKEFYAKRDILPTILVQDHTRFIKEFLGQDTGFRRDRIKPGVVILADVPGTDEVKYLFGTLGKGTFSFLGGHDPEDYAHYIGDPPTILELHKHSPGYRLILNNILFPAARKKHLKT